MKKTLIATAMLSLAAASAHAQQASSVTLYGIVDVNIAQSKEFSGSTVTGMNVYSPTNPRGSRFGMRGSENIGGGLRGIFQLEAGLNAENGTMAGSGSQLFNRHAWVGLAGGFGEFTVGRQETMHRVANNGGYNDVSTEGELSITTSNSGLQLMQNFGTRVNNAVRYTSPAFSGLRVRVQSALGQKASASTNGVMVSYDQGPFKAALVHEYYDGSGITGPSRWNEVTTLSGQYNFGAFTLALGYQQTDNLLASASVPASTAVYGDHTAYNVGVIVPVTKALTLRVQYTESSTKVGTSDRDHARTGISARYSLSPRTYMYLAYTEKDVDLPTATANKNSLGLGLSHAF